MSKSPTITTFEMRVPAAATPKRVEAAAGFIRGLLQASHPQMEEDSVTMEIRNYNTRALVHPRTSAGKAAAGQVVEFMKDPFRGIREQPEEARAMAQAIIDHGSWLAAERATFIKPRAQKPFAVLNEEYVEALRRLSQLRPAIELRGSVEVYSQIYRIGRTGDNKGLQVRIRVEGRPCEVPLAQEAEEQAWAAARSGEPLRIKLKAAWQRSAHGDLLVDPRRSKVVGLEAWAPTPGVEVLGLLQERDLFEGDVDDIIAMIEDR